MTNILLVQNPLLGLDSRSRLPKYLDPLLIQKISKEEKVEKETFLERESKEKKF